MLDNEIYCTMDMPEGYNVQYYLNDHEKVINAPMLNSDTFLTERMMEIDLMTKTDLLS